MTTILFIVIGIAILGALFWLLFAPQWNGPRAGVESLEIEQLEPLHCRHFPQIRMVLQSEDRAFIARRAPAVMAREWKRERRRVLHRYLNGLAEDFGRLDSLARLLATVSAEVSRKREWEWFWLGMQFRVMMQLLALRITLGNFTVPQFARLTDFVAAHAAELESSMAQMAGVLPSRMRPSTET